MADITPEYGRATRIVVSGYDRSRVHSSNLVRGEKRPMVISIKGAVPKGRTIASARWQCDDSTVLVMSNPRLSDDKRETAIDLLASWLGCGTLKCTITMNTGDVFAQLAVVSVTDGYWFVDGQSQTGPTDLTVTA
jgi:hypothetical protein